MGLQTSSSAILGIGLQTGLGTPQATNANFKYFATTSLGHGPNQIVTPLPPEAGRTIITRGAYKAALRASGPIAMLPRLENRFGNLLYAAMGVDTLRNDRTLYATPVTKAVYPATTISFDDTAGYHINDSASGLGVFTPGDKVTVQGSSLNDGEYTVTTVAAGVLTVTEVIVDETAGASVYLTAYGKAMTDCHLHDLQFDAVEAYLPYLTTRRKLPHLTAGSAQGETVADNRISSMELTLPNTGLLSSTFELLGRASSWDADPDTDWEWSTYGVFDGDADYALSVDPNSMVDLSGYRLKATGATITLDNGLLPPDQGMIIGSLYPVDYPVMGRAATIRTTAFVEDYQLYLKLFTNSGAGTTISSTPYVGNFRVRGFSPATFSVGGTAVNYALEMLNGMYGTEKNVTWTIQNALVLQPRQIVMLTLQGIIQYNSAGSPLTIRLQNNVTSAYVHP